MSGRRSAIAAGAWLAMLAALSFGLTTPIVARFGRGAGPCATAALLYAGACLSAFVMGRVSREEGRRLGRAQLGRLALVALCGAGVAPVLFAWGLQRTGATTGALLLNLEAVFTASLAWRIHREPLGRRVIAALALMSLGGVVLALGATARARFGGAGALGAWAVVGATFAWALDNTLSRGLAEQKTEDVVAAKGALGAGLTAVVAWLTGEQWPRGHAMWVLLACGATGYGLSLHLYLLAQRRMGAARTGSVFAVAPFVGAAAAWLLGEGAPGAVTLVAALLLAAGVLLHVTEHHAHAHVHAAVEHDHLHRHDDGHHDHLHHPPVIGEHAHLHQHARLQHAHEHAPDLHHLHEHPQGPQDEHQDERQRERQQELHDEHPPEKGETPR